MSYHVNCRPIPGPHILRFGREVLQGPDSYAPTYHLWSFFCVPHSPGEVSRAGSLCCRNSESDMGEKHSSIMGV